MENNMINDQSQEMGAQEQVDTLTAAYSQSWEGVTATTGQNVAQTESGFVQMMSSNDLWPVVLGVSLIIWFVFLFFLIRLERRLHHAELFNSKMSIDSSNSEPVTHSSEPKSS